jgi:hypothetical protein
LGKLKLIGWHKVSKGVRELVTGKLVVRKNVSDCYSIKLLLRVTVKSKITLVWVVGGSFDPFRLRKDRASGVSDAGRGAATFSKKSCLYVGVNSRYFSPSL